MRPERNSRRLFGITRAKGKMFEFSLPEDMHITVPASDEPEALLLLTMGTLGDAAAHISESDQLNEHLPQTLVTELGFSASFFDAFIASKFSEKISQDALLLAASSYYIVKRPGSSLVLAQRLEQREDEPPVEKLLRWLLQAKWRNYPTIEHPYFGSILGDVAKLVAYHFYDGSVLPEIATLLNNLRLRAYAGAEARDLFMVDVISAIIRMRLAASAWVTLPEFSGVVICVEFTV